MCRGDSGYTQMSHEAVFQVSYHRSRCMARPQNLSLVRMYHMMTCMTWMHMDASSRACEHTWLAQLLRLNVLLGWDYELLPE